MEFVGAFLFPHGTITLDPYTRDFSNVPAVLPTSKEECIKLHSAMKLAAENLIKTKPDIIIMSTPHGFTLRNNYLFVRNKKAKGSAEWLGDWKEFTAEIEIDSVLTNQLTQALIDAGNPVEVLALGGEDDPVNLRWGEVVPWWFINEAAKNANFPVPKVILFGQSRSRFNGTRQNIPELLKLGANMSAFLTNEESLKTKRVAVVISSDLSHYHSKDPTSPYPYNENATVFDQYINNWATLDYKTTGNWENLEQNLLNDAGDLSDTIGSCGYTGLVFLHGFVKEYLTSDENSNLEYKAHIYYYSAPTYYGMLSSSWIL